MTTAKKGPHIFLIVAFTLTLLESITAIASRKFNFNYSYSSPISFLAYGLVGYLIAKRTNRKTGIVYAAFVGLFDATVGWWVSTSLNANTGKIKVEITPGIWALTAIFVMVTAAIFGLVGAWTATRSYGAKSTNR